MYYVWFNFRNAMGIAIYLLFIAHYFIKERHWILLLFRNALNIIYYIIEMYHILYNGNALDIIIS